MSEISPTQWPLAFTTWILANNNGDLGGILSCYHSDASVFPTFGRFAATEKELADYFTRLVSREDFHAEIVGQVNYHAEGNVTVLTGEYKFFQRVDGQMQETPADFTFILRDGKIMHHHSSADTTDYEMSAPKMERCIRSGALEVEMGFCNLTPASEPLVEAVPGRYTIVKENGVEISRHLSIIPITPIIAEADCHRGEAPRQQVARLSAN